MSVCVQLVLPLCHFVSLSMYFDTKIHIVAKLVEFGGQKATSSVFQLLLRHCEECVCVRVCLCNYVTADWNQARFPCGAMNAASY